MSSVIVFLFLAAAPPGGADLERARDAQDRAQLEHLAALAASAADKQTADAQAQYQAALAASTLAEVAAEVHEKAQERTASEAGMRYAEHAIALKPGVAEYHRILGTLCGQAAAAIGGLGALKYGHCALDEVNKALGLDPKAPLNYLSRGIGNYYLPAALGGGLELAIQDFDRAIALDSAAAEPHLWRAVALRKSGRNAEARKEFEKAVQLNPARIWARQQLEKTPAQ